MSNVQHSVLDLLNLHKPGYWGSTDPGAVGAGIGWIDTAQGLGNYLWKIRNQNNNGWDTICTNLLSDGPNSTTAAQAAAHLADATDGGAKVWHHRLDDTSTALDRLWSASKVNAHVTNAAVHRQINDAGSSATDLWSASKIIAQLGTKQNNVTVGQLVPVGTILDFGFYNVPAGYAICNGAALSRVGTYATLFGQIGTIWGVGDGSNTFNVPWISGAVKRMGDYGSGRDVDAGSRVASQPGGAVGNAIGTYQSDQVVSHLHGLRIVQNTGGGGSFWGVVEDWQTNLYQYDTTSIQPAGGSETRMKNVYVTCGIKY